MVFSSCQVTNGSGLAVVTSVGMQTKIGEIARLIATKKGKQSSWTAGECRCLPDMAEKRTPLQEALRVLGVDIGKMALAVCVIIWCCGVAGKRTDVQRQQSTDIYMTFIAITLAVAAIPEGLPLCVTISLANGSSKMVKKNVIVRKLAAVETLGCASVICTDKTGTLTEGKMTMVKGYVGFQEFDVSGRGFDPSVGKFAYTETEIDASKDAMIRSLMFSALLCCNTTVTKDEYTGQWRPNGNSSEVPLVVAAGKLELWLNSREDKTRKRVLDIPFNSKRKLMLTVTEMDLDSTLGEEGFHVTDFMDDAEREAAMSYGKGGKGKVYVTVAKGAPNILIDTCGSCIEYSTGVEDKSGRQAVKMVGFDTKRKSKMMNKIDTLSLDALRVLACGVRVSTKAPLEGIDLEHDLNTADHKFEKVLEEGGLHFFGLFASVDPPREGVTEAVQQCHTASVRVTMITGDYLKTAVAIAEDIGIISVDADDITGNQHIDYDKVALDCEALRPASNNGEYLDDFEMDTITCSGKIFARARPEDKMEIVRSLQRQGLCCAMTGDGVNDAPALSQADIGVAMGIAGTSVAKGASDMILADDNFVSIVSAIEMGRVVYAGIQKFLVHILAVHIAEVTQIFICLIFDIPPAVTPLQILFLILVTDLPPAVALGMEPGDKGIMGHKPRDREANVIVLWMGKFIGVKALACAVPNALCYFAALQWYVGDLDFKTIANRVATDLERFDECADKLGRRVLGAETYVSVLDAKTEAARRLSEEAPLSGASSTTSSWYHAAQEPWISSWLSSEEDRERGFTLRHLSSQGMVESDEVFEACYDSEGTEAALIRAQTSVFIGMVWSENAMGYVARSFDKPIWVNFLGNPAMQKATIAAEIGLAIGALVLPAVWFPARKYFLSLNALDLGFMGWCFAFLGVTGCVVLCELYKWYAQKDIKAEVDASKQTLSYAEQERTRRQARAAKIEERAVLDSSELHLPKWKQQEIARQRREKLHNQQVGVLSGKSHKKKHAVAEDEPAWKKTMAQTAEKSHATQKKAAAKQKLMSGSSTAQSTPQSKSTKPRSGSSTAQSTPQPKSTKPRSGSSTAQSTPQPKSTKPKTTMV
jgi:magnesium-transporting ATPase (P-type)